MKDELRKACCWQRAHEDMMRELRPSTEKVQKLLKDIIKDLIEDWEKDGLITKKQASRLMADLEI